MKSRILIPNGQRRAVPVYVTAQQWTEFIAFMQERDTAMALAIDALTARLDAADIPPVVLGPPIDGPDGDVTP